MSNKVNSKLKELKSFYDNFIKPAPDNFKKAKEGRANRRNQNNAVYKQLLGK